MASEYSLDDFMADPITRQLMARDRVGEAEVRSLAARVRARRIPEEPTLLAEPRSFEG